MERVIDIINDIKKEENKLIHNEELEYLFEDESFYQLSGIIEEQDIINIFKYSKLPLYIIYKDSDEINKVLTTFAIKNSYINDYIIAIKFE